jgi:hypothetical protein
MIVQDGVYSRVTVQIEAQPQPENCVEFLNQLEVRKNGATTIDQKHKHRMPPYLALPKYQNFL